MNDDQASELSALVDALNAGDRDAATRMFEALYNQLRTLARARLRSSGPSATLNPTELVHETLLRMDASPPSSLKDSRHFVGMVGRAMRRVVIDRARRHRALKRGADPLMTTLAPDEHAGAANALTADDLLELDAALIELESRDPEMARLVELKYFTGLTFPEVAEALEISERSAHRRWAAARAWLLTRLS